ncbi:MULTISPECIES: hypothetical protein [Chryseobacterium]|uniref:hypothetical protein n=1 Tax=Chryseobacterium TaxID=59732 RepID=UPI0019595090|nr:MULTISPECIES: hypothetical protein [Chryseobacterium]MBM7418345.1 Ni,Fe-hydrogenase I large subunit [Chryseobacterium sp. JUb44]MDH6212558.1 Ni,Fe-hydrogenase I large subunit [Chryseobacterium sp. BIGb0186]WSO11154.1 hypothetical protein VUJ64_04345 [Chryseobacterium scophthalmum]
MAYTVISVFPETVNTEEIKSELKNKGFLDADIIVSKSRFDEESSTNEYEDDEKTKSFWNHVFVNDNEILAAYSKESVGKINLVVYASNLTDAQNAKKVLDQYGALKIYNKPSVNQSDSESTDLPEDVYNGIIAKARHNVYFLDKERVYSPNSRGMGDTMDSQGSKD